MNTKDIIGYKLVMAHESVGFNQEVEELVADGYVPYDSPFIREAFSIKDGSRTTQYFTVICQTFVRYKPDNLPQES